MTRAAEQATLFAAFLPASRVPRALAAAAWAFLFWTLLGVFFASQIYLLERRIPWGVALGFTMPRWYSWGLLAPAIFRVDRWLGAGRSLAARLAWHLPLGVAWTALSLTLRLLVRPLRGSPWPPDLAVFVLERFHWDIVIYAVIAGVSISRDYATQIRQREREAHALEVQASGLERALAEARLQSLRAQLQPHFLFNALNTISALTETEPRTARRLMGQLGDLLRASLTHGESHMVTLAEELTFLDDYLAIEAVRFQGRIALSVHAEDDALHAMVPGFLLQPLVENAIRHGVAPRLSGGRVDVSAVRDGAHLRLRVRDNGVGLPPDWERRRGAGVGLQNVASRLDHLYGEAHVFRVVPSVSGGVEVQLDLPWEPSPTAAAPYTRVAGTHG